MCPYTISLFAGAFGPSFLLPQILVVFLVVFLIKIHEKREKDGKREKKTQSRKALKFQHKTPKALKLPGSVLGSA